MRVELRNSRTCSHGAQRSQPREFELLGRKRFHLRLREQADARIRGRLSRSGRSRPWRHRRDEPAVIAAHVREPQLDKRSKHGIRIGPQKLFKRTAVDEPAMASKPGHRNAPPPTCGWSAPPSRSDEGRRSSPPPSGFRPATPRCSSPPDHIERPANAIRIVAVRWQQNVGRLGDVRASPLAG